MRSGDRRLLQRLSRGTILTVLLSLFAAVLTRADPTVDVAIGWGNRARAGRWVPIYVEVADAKARNATLEIFAPHDASQAMQIRQPIALGPVKQTYMLYAPLLGYGEPTKLTIRDLASGKLLTDKTIIDPYNYEDPAQRTLFPNVDGTFVGVTGHPGLSLLESNGGANSAVVGFLEQVRLPRSFRGYDALDALVLNRPNWSLLETPQQIAIAEWVKAGGHVVLILDENPVPTTGPLAGLLPCRIGDVVTVEVSKDRLRSEGLGERFGKFKARQVVPAAGAKVQALLPGNNGGGVAVTMNAGLGRFTVLNFDAPGLQFDNVDRERQFWAKVIDIKSTAGYRQIQDNDRAQAASQLMDMMGDVPGVGTFGFGYVAIVMIGVMLIVGPVDWFVLKWMGRQPWTWVTTAGWVGLITACALSLGSLLRSGDLHYRTVQIVDQVGNETVARTDALGLYSPRTTEYVFDVRPTSWWEPMTTDTNGYSRDLLREIPFAQDGRQNTPLADTVHVWNLRFLLGESAGKGDPVFVATLARSKRGGNAKEPRRITGTIQNVTGVTLNSAWLRLGDEVFDLTRQAGWPAGGLPAQATVAVDLASGGRSSSVERWSGQSGNVRYGRFGTPMPDRLQGALSIVKAATNLPSARARRVEERLQRNADVSEWVAIYAEAESSDAPAAGLKDAKPIEKHWQVFRALVPLSDESK